MAFKTECIVLRHRRLYGADRVYELFSPEYGIISAVARGAAKTGSKMAGFLEPLSRVYVMIGRGRQDHLAGARVIESFRSVRESLPDYLLAASLVELVRTVALAGQQARAEYALLLKAIRALADPALEQRTKAAIVRIFLWRTLSIGGWQPNLDRSALSREPLDPNAAAYLSPHGFISLREDSNAIELPPAFLPFLTDVISSDDWDRIVTDSFAYQLTDAWRTVSQKYYQDIVSAPLFSTKLFAYV